MKPFSVNTPEFINGQELSDLISFISNIIKERSINVTKKYPDYKIKSRGDPKARDWNHYPLRHNVPFFDVVCESFLYKDNCGFIEINEFTYQVNCFSKAIVHRKLWIDTFNDSPDEFLPMVWHDWQQNQIDNEFDKLQQTATLFLEQSQNLLEYHKNFLYNDEYQYVAVEDLRQLFDQLIEVGVFLSKDGDLYKICDNISFDTPMDTKTQFHNYFHSPINELYIRSKFKVEFIPKLQKLKTKFNFIPIKDDMSKFEPLIALVKVDKKIWFIPQFLVFYS
jgi:hypothetical protein